ncbi:uncharacterized protein EHS24_007140 [Apiotrichum porosum]|uniref:Probable RNA polymerase II nuclear localization protein SLC7A6OS n=1 Tax=Apiotrichum porosum TaxID=105984 RepID=A0A427XXK3_9TREE|nr:uncharacterized protein EHS24_007140 [Apiotrichum porosum]RSH83455.1 hypothetical protein EHS24_007140 [Apiotrichum porosum]
MSQPQYTVLRIKRKATETPLSQLVISGDPTAERAHKRRDVSIRGRGVFRLAETVPQTWQGSGEEGEVLKSRIEVLLSGSGSASPSPAVNQWLASSRQAGTTAPTAAPAPAAPEAPAAPVVPAAPAPAPGPSSRTTQFRVMPRPPKRDPNLPPRVITNAELDAARSALVFVDAQAVRSSSTPDEPEDKEMAAFQSMLTEYLKLEAQGATKRPPPARAEDGDDDGDGDYVYDLYYRDLRTDGLDVSGEGIGALLGYDDLSPPSTPPDSEPEDEADEDSNDEDYYRNEYPEDEDADEDMEGFDDAYSDGAWSRDSNQEDDERDPWDGYR